MNIDNPFFHRGAIRQATDFHGREPQISEILGLLRNGQSVSIIGPRRIGKSSLLLQLCRPDVWKNQQIDGSNTLFVLIDCQELGGSPVEEVYESLYVGLLDAAEVAGLTMSAPAQQPITYRTIDRAINEVVRQDISIVILLDEFELLAANEDLTPYFFARLRGLTTKYGLAYITASQRPLYAITADEEILSSPFFNIFVTLSLAPYTLDEANGLLDKRLAHTGFDFSPECRSHIYEFVGTHPFFLHLTGYHIFQAMQAGSDISNAIVREEIEVSIEMESDSHLSYLWNNLTRDEQYALATADGAVDIVRMLEQQSLLIKVGNGLDQSSELLRRFVRRQQVPGLIQAGPFVIDPQRHQVKAKGGLLGLTNSQFSLLSLLAERFNQVVRGEELETTVWGEILVDDPDRLKTLIKRLRRAIEPYNDWVVSERGVGYALREPE